MHRHLIGPFQHILVFGEQRLRDKQNNLTVIKSLKQRTASTVAAAEGRDDHRSVENEAHRRRVSPLPSSCRKERVMNGAPG